MCNVKRGLPDRAVPALLLVVEKWGFLAHRPGPGPKLPALYCCCGLSASLCSVRSGTPSLPPSTHPLFDSLLALHHHPSPLPVTTPSPPPRPFPCPAPRPQKTFDRARGFGFLEFRDPRDAEEAMHCMDKANFMGREISVSGGGWEGGRGVSLGVRACGRAGDSESESA